MEATWEAFVGKRELGILVGATPATPATQSLVTTGKVSLALGIATNALALQQHICWNTFPPIWANTCNKNPEA